MLKLFNTASGRKEKFQPAKPPEVTLYTCGPTVYNFLTLGNLRTYVFEDILRRVLEYNGYQVRHLMNITDVGHLTSDADTGEDKIQKQAEQKRETAWQVAARYSQAFQKDFQELNIIAPSLGFARATDHINEQIAIIQALEDNGFTYRISDGVYFDTSRFPAYADFAHLDLKNLEAGARVPVQKEKRNPTDFALWKFSPLGQKRDMEWDSPWGKGFPGWHIECSAMAMKHLAPGTFDERRGFHPDHFQTLDIHTGGIDHIPVHHTNEIAQSEAVTGKKFVRFWLHGAFLTLDDKRMGKSEGNMITASTLKEKGYWPLIYRYLLLQTHYRSPMNFHWDALESARTSLYRLYSTFSQLPREQAEISRPYSLEFQEAVNNDLNIPKAVAVMWELVQSKIEPAVKRLTLEEFDKVFGLALSEESARIQGLGLDKPSPEVRRLLSERSEARADKNFSLADELRKRIQTQGFEVRDTTDGTQLVPTKERWKPTK